MAAHTQCGECDRRVMASPSLPSPACTALSRAKSSSSCTWVTCRSCKKYCEKAAAWSAASINQCSTVLGSTSKTRATARMPSPSANAPTAHTNRSGVTRLPWNSVPWGARSKFPANMCNERRAGFADTTELTTKPESSMMLQSARLTKRSMDMTSDPGLIRQDTDDARHIQEVLDELHQMQQTPRLVTSPEELETLEREIRQRTDQLGSLLVGYHLQQALDSPALQAEQDLLVS